jgi:hypothetical protein
VQLASRLHGGQQHRDENADDGDHHQQLYEGKTVAFHRTVPIGTKDQQQSRMYGVSVFGFREEPSSRLKPET